MSEDYYSGIIMIKKYFFVFQVLLLVISLSSLAYPKKSKSVNIENIAGVFKSEYGTEIELILWSPSELFVNGFIITSGGNTGELSFVLYYYKDSNEIVYHNPSIDYKIVFKVIDKNTLSVTETNSFMTHGMNVDFSGTYKRIK